MTIEEINNSNESIENAPGDKLYLLVSEDGTMFKIGITQNIGGRVSQLEADWGQIGVNRSYIVAGDDMRMRSLEKMLHFLYDSHNIEHDNHKDGHTEWFDIDCFGGVVEEVERVASLKSESGLKIQKGITLPKTSARSSFDKESRERMVLNRQDAIKSGNFERAEEFAYLAEQVRQFVEGGVEEVVGDEDKRIIVHITGATPEVDPLISPLMRAGYIESFNGAANSIPHCEGEREVDGVTHFHMTINQQTLEDYSSHPESEVLANRILDFLKSLKSI